MIRYVAVSNEKAELGFALYRDATTNVCYVNETVTRLSKEIRLNQTTAADARTTQPARWKSVIVEAGELTQCGDNFISEWECTSCGCCWNDRRRPTCYRSYGQYGQFCNPL